MRSTFTICCLIAFAICVLQCKVSTNAQLAAAPVGKVLEYKVVTVESLLSLNGINSQRGSVIRDEVQESLNKLAVDGWECCTGVQVEVDFSKNKREECLVFKRWK